ncbi:hypothetical protein RA178_06210 [Shewanella oncorhynchi]|uniref:Uncharacterized protein n=1 Tax=Shewanella oncorhynchi TaxID=2726434 RepID=A0AA50KF05_9GAMM|nr:hypothetical protein [Shewanella oncorhynchi]WMB74205.1 hypothetical protein RA178_06210 [Shewanella oncorhynchi]
MSLYFNGPYASHHLIGTEIDTQHGKATITEFYDKREVWIKFHNTGYETTTTIYRVNAGTASDPTHPTVCGVGFMGEGEYNSATHEREYHMWNNMIRRCYQVANRPKEFKSYEGVTVATDWHNFQNFCEDIQWLIGYDDWLENEERYEIDKDLMCAALKLPKKVYSKETCCFLTASENSSIARK